MTSVSVHYSFCQFLCHWMSTCRSIFPLFCLPSTLPKFYFVWISFCLPVILSACYSVCLSSVILFACHSVCLPFCLPVILSRLSVFPSFCLPVILSVSLVQYRSTWSRLMKAKSLGSIDFSYLNHWIFSPSLQALRLYYAYTRRYFFVSRLSLWSQRRRFVQDRRGSL